MKSLPFLALMILATGLYAQVLPENMQFEPSLKYPWGRPNPNTPEVLEFQEMIGTCTCQSITRNPDQTWSDTTQMVWKFKYIMNGTAVQDEVWRNDGRYAGSIRQYHQDSAQWVVSYYSNPGIPWTPGVWHGSRSNDKIILYKPQKAPNEMAGFYRITFQNLSTSGYDWIGEWTNEDESIVYPTWKIFCRRKT